MIDPKEIDNQKFEVSFRGYNQNEVDEFLESLSDRLTESNKEFEKLQQKCASLTIEATEAREKEEASRNEREAAIKEAKDTALRAKFDADKAVAAAKREAMLIVEEAKKRAEALRLASRRSADKAVTDARREAAVILSDAKVKREEIILSAEASTAAERTEFENIKHTITEFADEMNTLAARHLEDVSEIVKRHSGEIGEFCEKVNKTNFGEIDIHADIPYEKDIPSNPTQSEENPFEQSEKTEKKSVRTVKKLSSITPSVKPNPKAKSVGAPYSRAKKDPFVEDDDDTYDFDPGSPENAVTAEFDSLPVAPLGETPEDITDDELDKIFSFDVEDILNNKDM